MNLRQLFFKNNACYKAGKLMEVKGIVVHSTGVNNPNLRRYVGPDDGLVGANLNNNHWNVEHPDGKNIGAHPYVAGNNGRCATCGGRQVCVHSWIGKLANGNIASYQSLPWDMCGWHCGGSANNSHIGIEICEDGLNDKGYFALVYKEAVELCAYLCKMFKLNPMADGVLIDHSEGFKRGVAGNHGDVGHWFPRHEKSMNTFRNDVRDALLNANKAPASSAPSPQVVNSSQLSKFDSSYPISEVNIKAMVDLGIVNTPQYWRTIDSVQWLNELMANVARTGICDTRINNHIPDVEIALQTLVDAGVINSPDYWRKMVEKKPTQYIDALIINMANKCRIVLEKIVHAESQGEGLEGQEYVANVIINREKDKRFPRGIYPVVFAGSINNAGKMVYQFSPIGDGAYVRAKPGNSVKAAVTNVLNGKDASKGALYFCTKASAAKGNYHESELKFLFEHRNHRFYL